MEVADRKVARTDFPNGMWVSTVFLGLDHNHWGRGPPLLFETMIFGAKDGSEYQERCSTWEEAEEMHKRAVYMTMERYLQEHDRHNGTTASGSGDSKPSER